MQISGPSPWNIVRNTVNMREISIKNDIWSNSLVSSLSTLAICKNFLFWGQTFLYSGLLVTWNKKSSTFWFALVQELELTNVYWDSREKEIHCQGRSAHGDCLNHKSRSKTSCLQSYPKTWIPLQKPLWTIWRLQISNGRSPL